MTLSTKNPQHETGFEPVQVDAFLETATGNLWVKPYGFVNLTGAITLDERAHGGGGKRTWIVLQPESDLSEDPPLDSGAFTLNPFTMEKPL